MTFKGVFQLEQFCDSIISAFQLCCQKVAVSPNHCAAGTIWLLQCRKVANCFLSSGLLVWVIWRTLVILKAKELWRRETRRQIKEKPGEATCSECTQKWGKDDRTAGPDWLAECILNSQTNVHYALCNRKALDSLESLFHQPPTRMITSFD